MDVIFLKISHIEYLYASFYNFSLSFNTSILKHFVQIGVVQIQLLFNFQGLSTLRRYRLARRRKRNIA